MKDNEQAQCQAVDQQTPSKDLTEQPNTKRRMALLGGIGTAAAAAVWHKPLINSVLLPVHAQMSVADPVVVDDPAPVEDPVADALVFFAAAAAINPIVQNNSILDVLFPVAHAGDVMEESSYQVSVEQTAGGEDNYIISVFERVMQTEKNVGELLYSGMVSEASGGTLGISDNPCERDASPITVEINSINDMGVVLNFTDRGESVEIPSGTGSLPTPMCIDTGLPESFYNPEAPATGGASGKFALLDLLVPQAHAGIGPSGDDTFAVLATKIDEDSYTVGLLSVDRTIFREGTIATDGSAGGVLRFVEDACDGEPRAPRDIPATIDSVNDSEMVITIENRGGDMITMTLPAQDGMLMATCEVMASSFTNDEPEKINFGDSLLQPAPNLGDKLIEFLIPNAEAQIIIGRGNVTVQADNNGGGNFTVTIGVANNIIDAGMSVNPYTSVVGGDLSSGGMPVMLTLLGGCNFDAEASISVESPDRLRLDLDSEAFGQQSISLRPGSVMIEVPTSCDLPQ